MKRWLVFDTETTDLLLPSEADLKKQPRIIEIGLIAITKGTDGHSQWTIKSERSWLINPEQPLNPDINRITGLKDEDLAGKPVFADVLPELELEFCGAWGLACHNMPFDRGMLVAELKRLNREYAFPYPPQQLCTVSSYSHIKGHNLKLTDLYEHTLKKPLAQTHRALDDARALAEILLAEGALE